MFRRSKRQGSPFHTQVKHKDGEEGYILESWEVLLERRGGKSALIM